MALTPNGAGRCSQPGAMINLGNICHIGPHLRNSEITQANIVNAVQEVANKHDKVIILNMVGAVKNTLAQPKLDLS